MAEPVAQQTVVRLMPALAAEAAVNPELAERLRSFVFTRRTAAREALQRGMDRGDLDPAADIELSIDLLTGALLCRLFFSGAEVGIDVIEEAIAVVIRGIAAGETAT